MSVPVRRASILDVARVAKVAPSTVSRCLRGGSYVSEDVRERVTAAVKLLNYEPNHIARSLRGDRSKSIGIVFPQIANPFFSRCVQQIEWEATRQGYAVVLVTHQEDREQQSRQLAALRRSQCDGIILAAAPGTDLENVRRELGGIPAVGLDRPIWKDADVVMLRHRDAARMATEHLLEHGLREIACVTAVRSVYSFTERILGYEQTMRQAALKSTVIAAPDYVSLQSEILQVMRKQPTLGALLCLSNMATVAAMKALRELQSATPRSTAIVAFDDGDFAMLVEPSLTVMAQPTELMARTSIELLFQRIHGNLGPAEKIRLKSQLVCRESCGCQGDALVRMTHQAEVRTLGT